MKEKLKINYIKYNNLYNIAVCYTTVLIINISIGLYNIAESEGMFIGEMIIRKEYENSTERKAYIEWLAKQALDRQNATIETKLPPIIETSINVPKLEQVTEMLPEKKEVQVPSTTISTTQIDKPIKDYSITDILNDTRIVPLLGLDHNQYLTQLKQIEITYANDQTRILEEINKILPNPRLDTTFYPEKELEGLTRSNIAILEALAKRTSNYLLQHYCSMYHCNTLIYQCILSETLYNDDDINDLYLNLMKGYNEEE